MLSWSFGTVFPKLVNCFYRNTLDFLLVSITRDNQINFFWFMSMVFEVDCQ